MEIRFDDAAASALVSAARAAEGVLRRQGVLRRGAVETAMEDFSGGYADLLPVVATIEAEDRGRLARVLDDLADDVEVARDTARRERRRLKELAAWQVREEDRERRRRTDDLVGGLGANIDAVFDPKPSEVRIAPPTVSAAFAAHERNRSAGGGPAARSSADPDRLRVLVSQARSSDVAMEQELRRTQNAWAGFTAGCAWVPLGTTSFLTGFQRMLEENRKDATWIEGVAAAFEAAGGTALSNAALALAATSVAPLTDRELLEALATLEGRDLAALLTASPGLRAQLKRMDPATVNAWWHSLDPASDTGARFSPRQDLLLTTLPVQLGNLEGMPYGARDHANRIALTATSAALTAQVAEARARVDGRTLATSDPTLLRKQQALAELEEQLAAVKNIRSALRSPSDGAERHLVSLTEDRPPLAAISIGDLDTATSVTYAVPGMGTTTLDMTGWTRAAQNLHLLLPEGSAVVSWIGYKTPPVPSGVNLDLGVLDVNRAVAGGHNLAAALNGLAAARATSMPRLNLLGHSYGTTTAAVALTQPGIHVNTFVTLGSAGLPDNVRTAADLNVDSVFSGHARDKYPWETETGDQWAWLGRDTSRDHHVNPMSPGFGSTAFGVENGGEAGRPVTDHDPLKGDGDRAGYLDRQTESLRNVAFVISGDTARISSYMPMDPTNFQQSVIGGATFAY